jgi:HK97 family phage portal protein
MGLLAAPIRALQSVVAVAPAVPAVAPGLSWQSTPTTAGGNFTTFARAYSNNDLVFAAIELLSTSASEPHIVGHRWRRNRAQIRGAQQVLNRLGIQQRHWNTMLVHNRYLEEVPEHPLVRLLNNPNPLKTRFEFWSTFIMDRYLAGNSYALKARVPGAGNVVQLWRLRPDRVSLVTDARGMVTGYEYRLAGAAPEVYAANDIIHWKTRNPFDDRIGMPPLMAVANRIDIDNFMSGFLRRFYEGGGLGPGAILTVKNKLSDDAKTMVRDRLRHLGRTAETLVIDNSEVDYKKLGLDRGLRDALPSEIEAQTSARIAMAFGIPGSIIGLVIGYETSSYANKRQDWQVLWDVTLAPLYADLDDLLNKALIDEFGGIDQVCFDLSEIHALQEDEDALQDRARKNFLAGLWSFEEARSATGVDPNVAEGTFFVPASSFPTPRPQLEQQNTRSQADAANPPQGGAVNWDDALPLLVSAEDVEPEPAAERRAGGRPRIENDAAARDLWKRGERMRRDRPGMSYAQVAGALGVSERTYRAYRAAFHE